MAYTVETKICSKNGWFTPTEAKNYYGRYSRDGVTVHWWGDGTGASNHDNIVNYFLQQAQAGNKSVNYVVSDIKITKMVEPDNVAWASQGGNPTTVSIEFQPTLSAEGYKRGGWLIAQLEKRYGKKLRLYKHSEWFATACPGTIDLNRLRAEADKANTEGSNTVSADKTIKQVFHMGLSREPDAGALTTYRKTTDEVLVNSVYTSGERATALKKYGVSGYNWKGRLATLSAEVATANSKLQTSNAKLDDANKVNAELHNQLDAQTKQIEELNAKFDEQTKLVTDLQKQLDDCKNAGGGDENTIVKNWFSRLIDKIMFWNSK